VYDNFTLFLPNLTARPPFCFFWQLSLYLTDSRLKTSKRRHNCHNFLPINL